MIYYEKDNKLYASDIAITDESFIEITEEEYKNRLNNAVANREQGEPIPDYYEEATSDDYINALESLGVLFNNG